MRKGEQTRQEIIRKAAPIVNQRGYDGAALSDLASDRAREWRNLPSLFEQTGARWRGL